MMHKYEMKGSPENLQTTETTYASPWDTDNMTPPQQLTLFTTTLTFYTEKKRDFRQCVYFLFNKIMISNIN